MDAPTATPSHDALAEAFAAIVGRANVLTAPEDVAPYCVEWRDLYRGRTPFVLRPGATAEVAEIMKLADRHLLPVVPQGGNTGLVGGQVPDESGREIVLSLARMDAIREVDPDGDTITVEAGAILERIHAAARAADRLFPLTLASEGSCRIGGNIATNAGGTGVLAYGNTRDLVLGLEVVLASGEVWNGLRKLRKDNTGYDLKQLFIGSEGTLGIVTAATLKLFPLPKAVDVAMAAVASPEDAVALLGRFRAAAGAGLTAFELVPRTGIAFVTRHAAGARDPFAEAHPWYVLIEVSTGTEDGAGRRAMEAALAEGWEAGLVRDAVIAESLDQANALWKLRHDLSEVQRHEGGSIKHDVAVPVADVPAFIAEATAAVEALVPGCRPVPFGHLGDGNVHFNVSQPPDADKAAFLARWDEVNAAVHAVVRRFEGSIAAEHGIGRLKRKLVPTVRSELDLALMRRIKTAFDPNGILSPGRIL